jgi:hypothetical protein
MSITRAQESTKSDGHASIDEDSPPINESGQCESHVTRITAAPRRRRMGYRACCRCGWASRAVRTFGMAEFEAELHERGEAVKAAVSDHRGAAFESRPVSPSGEHRPGRAAAGPCAVPQGTAPPNPSKKGRSNEH